MNAFETLRKKAGTFVFNHLVMPPAGSSPRIAKTLSDYGHAFYYEELFSGSGADIASAIQICFENPGPVLDLGGGAGRLSIALACRGIPVMLVDHASSMLETARARRALLSKSAKAIFQISPQNITHLELDSEYQNIFSFNNVLEHFHSDGELLIALRLVNRHLKKDGHFFLDVHFPLYLDKDPLWKMGKWRYILDTKIEGQRLRVWSRTLSTETQSDVVCDHAVSENLMTFKLLRTKLRIRSLESWISFFELAGFHVCETWGSWKKEPISPALPKMVFKLGK